MALRSVRQEFDGAVACLRATADALGAAHATLAAARAVACDECMEPAASLAALRSLLGEAGGGGAAAAAGVASPGSWAGTVEELVAAVQWRLGEWEGLVQSQQEPSRVLRWASGRPE